MRILHFSFFILKDIKMKRKKILAPASIGHGLWRAVFRSPHLVGLSPHLKVEKKRSMWNRGEGAVQRLVSVDGQVVPISVVQISSEEGGIVLEKVDEGAHVNKGDAIVKLSNSNLDLEILNAESELAEKQDMLLQHPDFDGAGPSEQ